MEKFSELVEKNWSNAVFKASYDIDKYISDVKNSLKSDNAEIRSAAIAVLNEANISEAHDQIVNLIYDENYQVVEEVLEYLIDYCLPSDVNVLVEILKKKEHLFSVSSALNKIYQNRGPIIDEEGPATKIDEEISEWLEILRNDGYIT